MWTNVAATYVQNSTRNARIVLGFIEVPTLSLCGPPADFAIHRSDPIEIRGHGALARDPPVRTLGKLGRAGRLSQQLDDAIAELNDVKRIREQPSPVREHARDAA